MSKRKLNLSNTPLISKTQGTIEANEVFDPSNNHIPQQKKKFKNTSINQNVEAKNLLSNDTVNVCPTTLRSSLHSITSQRIKNICFICLEKLDNKSCHRCPVCTIKVHNHCLAIEEPTTKYKFEDFLWYCKQCRDKFCYKCIRGESKMIFERRCITCNLNLHLSCYESYTVKPLQQIQAGTYQCIPCWTLSNFKVEKIKDGNKESSGSHISSTSCLSNDEDSYVDVENDDDSTSNSSIISDSSKGFCHNDNTQDIPDITNWDKNQVYNYLLHHLPQDLVEQLYLKGFDGRAILLFQQKDLSSLNIQLASAMLFYKQVKILQTRKLSPSVRWR